MWATTHLSGLDKLEKDRFEKYMQEEDLPKLHELDPLKDYTFEVSSKSAVVLHETANRC